VVFSTTELLYDGSSVTITPLVELDVEERELVVTKLANVLGLETPAAVPWLTPL